MYQNHYRPIASALFAAVAVSLLFAAPAYAEDVQGSEDHPLVGRFEGSEIVKYDQKAFDEYHLIVGAITETGLENNADSIQVLEGQTTRITYDASQKNASPLEVVRAYRDSLEAGGFEVKFECANTSCGHRGRFSNLSPGQRADFVRFVNARDLRYLAASKTRPDGDVFVSVQVVEKSNGVSVQTDVVEIEPRERKVVVVKAEEIASAISEHGRIALYGVYFGTNEATIKPESEPTLDEIGQLLKDNADLKVLVVGHTDNQGDFDYNVDLSKRRAAAVIQALVDSHGIERGRMKPWGSGFTSPVASNRSEQGRAQNRRVELVELVEQ